jgi:hypothetical protein
MVFEVEAVFENVKISSWNWLNVKNKEFWVFLILVALVVFWVLIITLRQSDQDVVDG